MVNSEEGRAGGQDRPQPNIMPQSLSSKATISSGELIYAWGSVVILGDPWIPYEDGNLRHGGNL